jgi:hypothetical protein
LYTKLQELKKLVYGSFIIIFKFLEKKVMLMLTLTLVLLSQDARIAAVRLLCRVYYY